MRNKRTLLKKRPQIKENLKRRTLLKLKRRYKPSETRFASLPSNRRNVQLSWLVHLAIFLPTRKRRSTTKLAAQCFNRAQRTRTIVDLALSNRS